MQLRFNIDDGDVKLETDKSKWDISPFEKDTYVPVENLTTNIKQGDLFRLGEHRLLCGDATNEEDIQKILEDNKVNIIFTSPPYNTGGGGGYAFDKLDPERYDTTYYNRDGIYNSFTDELSDEDYSNLLISSAQLGLKYGEMVLYNMGILKGNKRGIIDLLTALKNNLCEILVWDKGNNAMPYGLPSMKGMVKHDAEFIFCFNHKGSRNFTHPQWSIGTKSNIIRCKNSSRNKYSKYHKATFSLDFALEIVGEFVEDSVMDFFGGTGTTMIASEYYHKKCYMIELDPLYCQIIINRWEEYTGKKSKKIE